MTRTPFNKKIIFSWIFAVVFVFANFFLNAASAQEIETQFNIRGLTKGQIKFESGTKQEEGVNNNSEPGISAEEKLKLELKKQQQDNSKKEQPQTIETEQKKETEQKLQLQIEREKIEQQKNLSICSVLNGRSADLLKKLSDLEIKQEQQRILSANNLKENRAQQDANLAKSRKDSDAKRGLAYANLEAKAATPEQKKAFADFKATIELAVKIRREAADQAIAAQRSGFNQLLNKRNSDVNTALKILQSQTDSALSKAKASCALPQQKSQASGTAIRGTLIAEIEAAKQNFETTVKSLQYSADLANLKISEQNSIFAALENFKKTVTAATLKLRTSFSK